MTFVFLGVILFLNKGGDYTTQGERVKELRKSLGLTLEKFGERLGVGKTAISKIEKGENNLSDQMSKSICREYGVNENWLLNGIDPMFIESDSFSLDEFVRSRGATAIEIEIVKTYFDLDPKIRHAALAHFHDRLSAAFSSDPSLLVPDTPEELEALYPPVDEDKENAG